MKLNAIFNELLSKAVMDGKTSFSLPVLSEYIKASPIKSKSKNSRAKGWPETDTWLDKPSNKSTIGAVDGGDVVIWSIPLRGSLINPSEDRDVDVEVKDDKLSRGVTAEEFVILIDTLFDGDESFWTGEPIDKRSIKISEPPEKAAPSRFAKKRNYLAWMVRETS